LNIFLNAIEAMPKGGTLTISTAVSDTSYFIIKVEDTGCGIPREDLSRIFDPYFSRKDHGTGLGLSITQSLIENHKGIIQIKSKVGLGTTMRIDLPC
jgi:two-component system sensor histidine kinase HydH